MKNSSPRCREQTPQTHTDRQRGLQGYMSLSFLRTQPSDRAGGKSYMLYGAVCLLPDFLMGRTQQVENGLDRVEGLQRHLYEQGVPAAHRTVPQARKLEGLQLAALVALA